MVRLLVREMIRGRAHITMGEILRGLKRHYNKENLTQAEADRAKHIARKELADAHHTTYRSFEVFGNLQFRHSAAQTLCN